MGQILHKDVQFSNRFSFREHLRELNLRIFELVQTVSINRYQAYPQVSFTTNANATDVIWLADESYDIESVNIYSLAATGTVTPKIDGVTVGGATPFNVTGTATKYPIIFPNNIDALQRLSILTAGLTGPVVVSFNLRRLN